MTDPHPIAEQLQYFLDVVLPKNEVRLALLGDELMGFVAASRESVAQLHVRVGFQRRGIGTAMLAWAKAQSAGSLWLFTFQRNHGACAFYEHNGFHVIARGFEPMWQLADVKYQWSADAARG
ncbi:MAG: GNAT family N-acetyltransferase [Pseudomonadota bacterium]